MSKLSRTVLFGVIVAFSSQSFANVPSYFNQKLGEPFNTKLSHKDVSDLVKSSDGTMAYAFNFEDKQIVPFRNFVAYLTPISKRVAIVEASKIEQDLDYCAATMRFFEKAVLAESFSEFSTLDDLKKQNIISNSDLASDKNSSVKTLYDITRNNVLQFGCTKSSSDSKYAFIVSVSNLDMQSVSMSEHDKLIATKG